jgi:nucleoside-diphosphate-sugar epimerase
MKIAIAGASGFVGQLLIETLRNEFDLIALGRSSQATSVVNSRESTSSGLDEGRDARIGKTRELVWRKCDLFSLIQIENGLQGADVGIYLVHSMLPSAALTQSNFEDSDLLLADNFARAAQKAGLKRIIYLGGLVPAGAELSQHLRSRQEVERALGSYGAPVTSLRAGLILGSQGSSFQMLYLLVKRLPVMICPKWTRTLTQCVSSLDVVNLIRFCLKDDRTAGNTYDLGSPEILSYQQLMAALAEEMGLRRRMFSVRFFSPGLSRLWVQLITGASRNLVAPLVESLRHEMVVRNPALLQLYGRPLMGIREALSRCLVHIQPNLRSSTRERQRKLRGQEEVRSIQRLPKPPGRSAEWLAVEYFRWLPEFLKPFVVVEPGDELGKWIFRFAWMRYPLLIIKYSSERSTADRQVFYVKGGLLASSEQSPNSRLEFREVLDHQIYLAAIHEFRPALPWIVYQYTQALVHLWVMTSFRRHLSQLKWNLKGSEVFPNCQ